MPIVQRGTKVAKMARERSGDRATILFVPIYGVSWGHGSRRGSRLGCFFHPRHLPSRYLFKVNGTGLVSQVCPKTGGFCPDLDGFLFASISKFLRLSFPTCNLIKGRYQKSLLIFSLVFSLLLLFFFITGIRDNRVSIFSNRVGIEIRTNGKKCR